jgi:hypothetical protein
MAESTQHALGEKAAFQLANVTKTPPAVSVHAAPLPATTKIPTETELRDLPAFLSGAKPPEIPASASDLSSPQIPGAAAHSAGFDRLVPFNFLDDLRQLERVDTVPSLVPSAPDFGKTGFNDLSSVPFDVNAIRRDFPIADSDRQE